MITQYAIPPTPSSQSDLDLSRNEGSPWFLETIDAIDDLVALGNRYPQIDRLRAAIAQRHKIDDRQVLVTAGGDDAMARCFLARAACSFVTTTPTFEMVRRYGEQSRSKRTEVSWWDGPFPTEKFTEEAGKADFSVVVSPNNPTGQAITSGQLRRVAEASPLVILDSAYAEFANEDLTSLALELGNVVVIRTMSKAFGLAGLRVGYLIGPVKLIEEISAFGSPYPISGVSAHLAELALGSDSGMQKRFLAEVRVERARLRKLATELGLESLPSQANFVLVNSANPGWITRATGALGIAIRSFHGREDMTGAVRISLPGNRENFDRLKRALATVLAPQCLLFDLDGVIVDVSRSYDEAIVATAASYGVGVTPAMIAAERARGNANDDWALTARLCRKSGVEADVDQVTARFETHYQGSDGRPPLKLLETPLVTADTLRRWKDKAPLGVVTGRPRSDAAEVLDRFGIAEFFDTVVTRDDAPMKPDPAPVRLALNNLGVDTGWLIGDSVDDLRAARLAGILPIAVRTRPGQCDEDDLATAAAILNSTEQLKEILDDTQL